MKSSEQSQTCQTLSLLWSSLKKYHKPKFVFIHPLNQQQKSFTGKKRLVCHDHISPKSCNLKIEKNVVKLFLMSY